jgi:HEPN domain-containing protein
MPAFNCFHAQQSAERSIKAVHVHLGLDFAHVHDIQKLLTDLPVEIVVPVEVEAAVILTKYAVASRYGTIEQPDMDDLAHAIHLAVAVFSWAEEIIALSRR